MLLFKKNQIPSYEFIKAVKKPIPIRCMQIHESFTVETNEGSLQGKPGDYLMIGVRGEMYPCPREVFEETYDIVQSGTT